jgi:hypothetical protein
MQVQTVRRVLAGATLVVGLAFAVPATASAQLGFLVKANYGDDVDFGVAGGVRFDLGPLTTEHGLRGEATFDYYSPDGFDYWEINGDLFLDIASVPGLYVGSGLNYAKFSNDRNCGALCEGQGYNDGNSDVGLNAIGGYTFPGLRAPFVQIKIELGGGEQFVVSGGIRF